jgi:phosphohistidine phosphatase SixA
MKHIISFSVLLAIGISALSQPPTGFTTSAKIYLVRHAEKDTGNNPSLTDDGKKRAGDLMRALKNKNIQRIYVTQYKRTQMTGDSLRLQLGIDTLHYLADTTGLDVYNKIISNADGGKNILIIGHSNTVPKIIKKLGGESIVPFLIPDTEFDNLYVLQYKRKKVKLKKMKYGKASGNSASMK